MTTTRDAHSNSTPAELRMNRSEPTLPQSGKKPPYRPSLVELDQYHVPRKTVGAESGENLVGQYMGSEVVAV